MKQTKTLDNACGIIACLHVCYNNVTQIGGLQDDSILGKYLAGAKDADPATRASLLENATEFKVAHAAAA